MARRVGGHLTVYQGGRDRNPCLLQSFPRGAALGWPPAFQAGYQRGSTPLRGTKTARRSRSVRRLLLDDERYPPDDGEDWAIARSFEEACAWVEANGYPRFVSFDNDFGPDQREGWEFAQWLIDRDLDTGSMPEDFDFYVHSQNPVRQADISARLRRYLEFRADRKHA